MLLIAALLTFILGVFHSYLGEKNVVQPILKMVGLPVILNSLNNTKVTIWVVWHMVTLFMWGFSFMMVYIYSAAPAIGTAFLYMVSVLFFLFGIAAIVLSRGAHKSWIVFFPVAAISGYVAYLG